MPYQPSDLPLKYYRTTDVTTFHTGSHATIESLSNPGGVDVSPDMPATDTDTSNRHPATDIEQPTRQLARTINRSLLPLSRVSYHRTTMPPPAIVWAHSVTFSIHIPGTYSPLCSDIARHYWEAYSLAII